MDQLPDCWDIKNCGRESGGNKVPEFGECPASVQKMGHSCWVLAGTFCGGEVQGTFAQKEQNCMGCEVFKRYVRSFGTDKARLEAEHQDEEVRYQEFISRRVHEE